ncbi:V-type proton ATPase 116 kDa subunit a 1-like [Condylostylus longicornis]|uniref:V-type proton ATPase 116 kDa subunit a 1-like n=1 Tax=Condylostylus longicornis TaxID=2530218 RepID=UPI00244DB9F9|nr:V-type proton ATPase 116 kDa subunit a 1-like [Condylostylus longicornis]XP_055384767.1 V-type proton ATPase 116 kDa subunit a 1-like [Condylostylus longicornis]XP_055384768.1 V-type proton ATPase 116 kDa subunit a 1-like [Condylostylus longicornis]XP_055384769.1 V-type proton ATPase 116 kDa subunit a 1-like [Condylostylus longicornis]
MGSMFRSEQMALCQMFIQPEAAYASLSELGEIGIAQFRDLHDGENDFQRKYVTEVRRCDELERKIRYIEKEINKNEVVIPPITTEPKALQPNEVTNLEAHLEKIESEVIELSQNEISLKQNFLELKELACVLESTQGFFTDHQMRRVSIIAEDFKTTSNIASRGRLDFVAGVVARERLFSFERMLWRISRGNCFIRQVDLNDPFEDAESGKLIHKTVFVAFFQGDQLKNRIKKVCAGFKASLYPCPNTKGEREEMLRGVKTRIEDLKMVLNQTSDHRNRVLISVANNLGNWKIMVKKMKAIYHTLNLCNMDVMNQKCLIAECWVPIADIYKVQNSLKDGSAAVGSTIPSFLNVINTNETPPTFNRTNRFTHGFQVLIDSYGMATYREANPALYTIVTFPFLFAVMYGDFGHGLILSVFGLWMVLNESKIIAQKSKNEIWNIFFGGRYIILMMGLFSIYTGLIYNDIFSKSVNIFGSTWRNVYNKSTVLTNKDLVLDPKTTYNYTYPFGMDPAWQMAENKIVFLNTYKMKLSIIFGVAHMVFGVCMSVVNHIHFRRFLNIFLEFMPQIFFLILLFGYMVLLMFIKWIKYSAKALTIPEEPGCAPSVLITFINMMLFTPAGVKDPNCETEYMFYGQYYVQMAFVAFALLCIPWMLLFKPLITLFKSKNHNRVQVGNVEGHVMVQQVHEEPFSEVFTHQAIHTIEYVLGTVSHTASYLRLWALSLAHAQLAEVLWARLFSMAFSLAPGYIGVAMILILFPAWAFLTIAILVVIEGLSAFLHTLRLHWVEFMSKFYEGAGYAFEPFSFKTILEADEFTE